MMHLADGSYLKARKQVVEFGRTMYHDRLERRGCTCPFPLIYSYLKSVTSRELFLLADYS